MYIYHVPVPVLQFPTLLSVAYSHDRYNIGAVVPTFCRPSLSVVLKEVKLSRPFLQPLLFRNMVLAMEKMVKPHRWMAQLLIKIRPLETKQMVPICSRPSHWG